MNPDPCPICGGVYSCPGDPPPGVVSVDEGLDIDYLPVDADTSSWCQHQHGTKSYILVHRAKPGYQHFHIGSSQAKRLKVHGWPHPIWVGQCDYVIAAQSGADIWLAGGKG